MMSTKKIRVLICDDSALIRQMLSEIISADSELEVVGTANDPFMARDMIKALSPDVLTLDVEMPKMDGLTFLRNLMRLRPMAVIMVSSLTEKGADITLQALEYGAIDFVAKPKLDLAGTLGNYAEEIVGKIKIAAKVKVGRLIVEGAGSETTPKLSADAVIKKSEGKVRLQTTEKIIAIGASTGGTEAIKEVLVRLPAAMPGIVITQHIPEAFSGPFAKRMNGASELTVCEAEDGQQILPGHVYISPGNRHLAISRSGARYICNLLDGPPVNRHKPSVDVMFRSVAQNVGVNAIGVILTGMGADGAQGMKELKESGAPTIAQDENSSVVWGMPGESVKLGCVDRVLDLYAIPKELIKMTK